MTDNTHIINELCVLRRTAEQLADSVSKILTKLEHPTEGTAPVKRMNVKKSRKDQYRSFIRTRSHGNQKKAS
jgi:hypothetical protein